MYNTIYVMDLGHTKQHNLVSYNVLWVWVPQSHRNASVM